MAELVGIQNGGVSGSTTLSDGVITDEFTETYLVKADSADEREPTIANVAGIPQIGEFWTGGSDTSFAARCTAVTATEKDALVWEVVCTFTTDTNEQDEEADKDPEARTPKVSWSYRTIQEVMEEDAEGTPTLNSFGDPLFPMHDIAIPVLTVTKIKKVFAATEILDYVNTANSDAFYGAAAKHAMITGINASQTSIQGEQFWEVTYVVEFRIDKTWELRLLDHGSKYKDAAGDEVNFKVEGQPTTGNLDGLGGKAPEGVSAFITFQRVNLQAFADLELGPF
jgi:hypothetical protein